jgi:hypothetical protein
MLGVFLHVLQSKIIVVKFMAAKMFRHTVLTTQITRQPPACQVCMHVLVYKFLILDYIV